MSKFKERIERFIKWSGRCALFDSLWRWIGTKERNQYWFMVLFNIFILSFYLTKPWIFLFITLILPALLFKTFPMIGPIIEIVRMVRTGTIQFAPFVITIFLMVINHVCVFASLYMVAGTVVDVNNKTEISGAWEHFYFSAVTYTTLGYGNLIPANIGAEIFATVEAIFGFATFALLVGLAATIPRHEKN